MSEADVEARLRLTEVGLASVTQRVQDHEGDIHRFGPLVVEQALLRQMAERELKSVGKSLDGAHEAIRELSQKLEQEHAERVEGQRLRKEELEEAVAQRRRETAQAEIAREEREAKLKNEMLLMEEARKARDAELSSRMRLAVVSFIGLMLASGISGIVAIFVARGGK